MRERMALTPVTRDDISAAETLLPNDVVRGAVDLSGRPSSRSKSGCWKSSAFIMGAEVAERFAYYGISSNLISYLTGPLGQPTATAAKNVNAVNGTAMLMPLLGAVIADSFLGRYRTVVIASVIYVVGLGFLSLSAALHSYNSSACKSDANNLICSPPLLELVVFYLSLYLVAFMQGGHKPCIQAFGADQFDEEDEEELKAKSSFFNWWNFTSSAGIFVAQVGLSYVQENLSWELGFGIPCILMCFGLLLFLLGSKTYRFHINNGETNPFVRIGSVFVKATRNWLSTEVNSQRTLPYEGAKFKFLDKAIVAPNGSEDDGNVCTMEDVDDARAVLRLVPIWLICLGYGVVFSQASTFFTKQGATMERSIAYGLQVPAGSLQSLMCFGVVIFIPIYDRIIVPFARTITRRPAGISMLQRIGTGIFLSIVLIVIAALVERRRLATALKHGLVDKPTETVPMSVWWLAPQFLLLGIGNALTMVGLQEFFYDQVPSELRSIGPALYISVFGVGSFLSSFLVAIIEKVTSGYGHESWFSNNLNRAHLDYFYWVLTGLSSITMVAYLYFAQNYIYKRKHKV